VFERENIRRACLCTCITKSTAAPAEIEYRYPLSVQNDDLLITGADTPLLLTTAASTLKK
jgi:hypothetical protein